MKRYRCDVCKHEFEQEPQPVCPSCRSIFVSELGEITIEEESSVTLKPPDAYIEIIEDDQFARRADQIYQYIKRLGREADLKLHNITRDTVAQLLREVDSRGEAELEGLGTIVDEGRFNIYHDRFDPLSAERNRVHAEVPELMQDILIQSSLKFYPQGRLAELRRERLHKNIETENSTDTLRALYYPYTEICNEPTLKNLILYFDKIYVISPYEIFDHRWGDVLEIIEPYQFENAEQIELFKENLALDSQDPNFQELAEASRYRYWKFHKAKADVFRVILPHYGRDDTVPFYQGESLFISMSLSVCQRYNLIPVTDDPIHHKFLVSRLQRVARDSRVVETLESHGIRKIKRATQTTTLATNVLSDILPNLGNISVQRLLEFRERHRDALSRFRLEMSKLSAAIQCEPWEDEFQEKLLNTIDAEIKPKLSELRTDLQELGLEVALEQFQSLQGISSQVASAGLPFVMSLFAGLPITAALGIGAGGLMLSNFIDYYANRRKVKARNTLTYLFDLTRLKRDDE